MWEWLNTKTAYDNTLCDGEPNTPAQPDLVLTLVLVMRKSAMVTANSSKFHPIVCIIHKFWLILPEATAIGVRLSHASREVQDLGALLSNTWTTYPVEGDNPGKLGIIPHRLGMLECSLVQRSAATGWVCGRLGCCWGNGPTSL